MVPALTLWLPVVVAAVLVFVASSVIHMALRYHRTDFRRLASEDDVLASLRGHAIAPGEYFFPFAEGGEEMRSEEWKARVEAGPVGFMTLLDHSPASMGKNLTQWFVYCVAVSLITAYVTGLAYGPGTEYMAVFRMAGTVAFVGYAVALWQQSIWYNRSWSTTLKHTADGLIYGLLTAGAFGWLWPGA